MFDGLHQVPGGGRRAMDDGDGDGRIDSGLGA
jgi:hypothetical protein